MYASLVFILLAVAGRMLAYPLMRVYRRSGGLGDPTVIVGSGNIGCQVADTLIEHPEYGLWPVGYVDDDPLVRDRRIPVMGGFDELPGAAASVPDPQRDRRLHDQPRVAHGGCASRL